MSGILFFIFASCHPLMHYLPYSVMLQGDYSIPYTNFTIPEIPVPSWLESGDYKASIKVYDKGGNNMACYEFQITLA